VVQPWECRAELAEAEGLIEHLAAGAETRTGVSWSWKTVFVSVSTGSVRAVAAARVDPSIKHAAVQEEC